jgi:hypothetical protein
MEREQPKPLTKACLCHQRPQIRPERILVGSHPEKVQFRFPSPLFRPTQTPGGKYRSVFVKLPASGLEIIGHLYTSAFH